MAVPTSCVPAGVLDEPLTGRSLPLGYALVRGWALSDPPVSSVRIRINHQSVGWARLGMPRPDVAAQVDRPEAEVCGFEAHLDLSRWVTPGEALVEAEVTRLDGSSYVLGPARVEITPGEKLAGWTTEPGRAFALSGSGTSPSPPRVLVFTHDLARGGAQLRMLDYLRLMAGPTCPQFAVVSQQDGPVGEDLAALGVPVHMSGSDGRESREAYEKSMQELLVLIGNGAYDVIWANTLVSFAGVDAALRAGLPSLFFIHEGLDPCLFWGPELSTGHMATHSYARCLVSLSSASSVVCVADAARKTFERYRRAPIVVLRNAIDVASIAAYRAACDRRQIRRQLGLEEMDRLVLSCAPIAPHKGQAVLVQAFASIAGAHPRTVCAMVGDFGHPYGDGIASYARRMGLEARVRLEPLVQDVYRWFQAADLFVLPSDDEALASVVLEAMAFEVPVVTTDVGGMPEVVADGEDGFLCQPRNVGALAQVLDKALSTHPAILQSMTVAGLGRVLAHHDIAARAGVLQGLIAGLVSPTMNTVFEAETTDGVGIDVALAIDVDLTLEGVANGSILQIGRGVGVAFALAQKGYSVTSVDIDVDSGSLAAWRRLQTSTRSSGHRPATPALVFDGLSPHLSNAPSLYDAAFVGRGWPTPVTGEGCDDVSQTLSTLYGRARRAYVGLPGRGFPSDEADGVVAGLAARGIKAKAEFVSSTVGLDGDPLRLYRIDLL